MFKNMVKKLKTKEKGRQWSNTNKKRVEKDAIVLINVKSF